MNNSTLAAESIEASAREVYVWEAPGKPITVHLSLGVVDRLEREVIESFKAVTKRGSEIGGVLLGRVTATGGRTVAIENYQPVACDYARGPLYLLAEPDKTRLADALQNHPPGVIPVGWFRSNTRRDLTLDEDDLALIEDLFPGPENVFLLVKPFAMKPSVAGFFFRENGVIHSESPYVSFPFRKSELLKTEAAKVVLGSGAPSAPERAAAPPTPGREDPVPSTRFAFRREGPIPVPPKPAPVAAPPAEPPKQTRPEARTPVVPITSRFEAKPAAPPPKPEPVPPVQPVLKREEPPAVPLAEPKKEQPAKLEVRPAVQPVAPQREEAVPAAPPKAPPVAPVAPKREDVKPAAAAKPQPLPSVQPVAPKAEAPKPAEAAVPPVTAPKPEAPKPEPKPAVQPVAPASKTAELPPAPPAPPKETPPAPAKQAAAPVPPEKPVRKEEDKLPAAAPIAPLPPPVQPRPLEPSFTFGGLTAQPAAETAEQPSGGRKRWILMAAAALVVVAVVLFFVFRKGSAPAVATDLGNSLGLKVERNAGQLLLSWNREAGLVKSAQRAILSISDGDHKEDVDLDLGQLRSGSIVYSPLTSDVSFRLEVTNLNQGKSLSESVRVLAGKPSPSVPAGEQQAAATGQPEASQSTEAAAQQPIVPVQPTRTFTPPPSWTAKPAESSPAESLAARVSAPPSLAETAPVGAPTPALPQAAAPAPPPPAPVKETPKPEPVRATPPPAASQPPAQQASQPPSAPKPVERQKVGGTMQQAEVLRRTTPMYPPMARQARVAGVVQVEATVGKDGRIKAVRAISGPPLLRQAATDAVKQWVFKPGVLNGEPVEVVTQVSVAFNLGR